MKFVIAKSLKVHEDLTNEFQKWVRGGKKSNNYFFGKDVSTRTSIPHPHYDAFMHVHCIPSQDDDDTDWLVWKEKLNSRSDSVRRNRTSDRILYYAVKGDTYLLLAIDGHSVMEPPLDKLNRLASSADNYFKS